MFALAYNLGDRIMENDEMLHKMHDELNKYKKAYGILMDYWYSFPDREKPIIHNRLKELDL